jgi:RNA polymerase sigma factor (sigma-70 family)
VVVAAQSGDPRALDELVAAALPMVYTIVRRALSGHPDADDVVQDTMLRALRELRTLRTPDSFRPWLAAIAMRQVSTYLHRQQTATDRAVALDDVVDAPDADADLEGRAFLGAELSRQRRQVVRAGRWLDADDRALLSVWWLETAGQLTRAELAEALDMSVAHAGVRVQRMRHQLEISRSLVAALDATPRCSQLAAVATNWNGVPSPLWRKRIARHTRVCPFCVRAADGLLPPEQLLVGFALLPVPVALAATLAGEIPLLGSAGSAAATGQMGVAGGGSAKAGLFGPFSQAVGAHPVAAALVAGALVAGAALAGATLPAPAPRQPAVVAAPAAPTTPGPTAPATPRPTAVPAGRLGPGPVSLESANAAGLVVSVDYTLGVLERIGEASDASARARATFEVVSGLANRDCVSLRAPGGSYLRHSSWRMQLSLDDGTPLFRGDATFCVRPGAFPGTVSLESANYPGGFLRHRGNELWVDFSNGTAAFRADASFRPLTPLAG